MKKSRVIEKCCGRSLLPHTPWPEQNNDVIRRQSYKINLVLKKSKFVLNLLTVRYINLDLSAI